MTENAGPRPAPEPAALSFAEATANPPYLFDLGPADGRKLVDEVQSGEATKPCGVGHHRRGRLLRDEGEACVNKLRKAGVPVTAVRYQGIVHDFVMLNAPRETPAAQAAIAQAVSTLRTALGAT